MCTFGQLQSLFVLRKYTSQSKIMNHISLDGFCVFGVSADVPSSVAGLPLNLPHSELRV